VKELYGGTTDLLKGNGTEAFKRTYREYIKSGDIRHSNFYEGLWDLLICFIFPMLLRAAVFDTPDEVGKSYKQQYAELFVAQK